MATPTRRQITTSELSTHTSPESLWIAIHGKVYDVTKWLHLHPGGDIPLLSLAGQDVTDAFLAYHPQSAWSHLASLPLLGTLSDHSVSEVSSDYRRLLHDLSRAGLFDREGGVASLTIFFIIVLLFTAVYYVMFTSSTLLHLFAGAIVGFSWIQSGWLGHDSGHYKIFKNGKLNRIAQVMFGNCLTGLGIAWWKMNHNAHHIACNSLEFDPDLQHMPLFAVSDKLFGDLTSYFYERKMRFDTAARFLVSYQHFTFYPVMCFARINLLAQSISLLVSGKKVQNWGQEVFGVAVFWIWYPLLVSCLPNWGERVMFVVASFVACGIQHVQFCLNHFSSSVYVGRPEGNDWFQKQTMGTLNIDCASWMDWFHGGLQYQVEHHLFPRMPRCHYRKISPFVKELCKKHKLTYSSASFWKANVLTYETLKNAALQARDLSNPVPRNLVWEAVNHQG